MVISRNYRNENGGTVTFLLATQRTIKTQIFIVTISDIFSARREVPLLYGVNPVQMVGIGEHFTTHRPAYDWQ